MPALLMGKHVVAASVSVACGVPTDTGRVFVDPDVSADRSAMVSGSGDSSKLVL